MNRSLNRLAQFRADLNLSLADALQVATALAADCDAFITNDLRLKRVSRINVIVIQELKATQ
jgi:predicted nucleic acid-binding protein